MMDEQVALAINERLERLEQFARCNKHTWHDKIPYCDKYPSQKYEFNSFLSACWRLMPSMSLQAASANVRVAGLEPWRVLVLMACAWFALSHFSSAIDHYPGYVSFCLPHVRIALEMRSRSGGTH